MVQQRITASLLALSAAALGLTAARPALAQTAAYSFTGGTVRNQSPTPNDPFGGSIGFTFTTGASPLLVSSLGIFNGNGVGVGLHDSHQVAIYNLGGTQLALATVAAGSVGSADTNGTVFAYTALGTPIQLLANTQYEVMAYVPKTVQGTHAGDPFVDAVAPGIGNGGTSGLATFSPLLTYTQNRYDTGTSGNVAFGAAGNNNFGQNDGYFGPNLLVAAAPEPSSIVLFGSLGLTSFGLIVRKRS
jgi:hypothetical protein